MLFNPFLIVISMFLGMLGGWLACIASGMISSEDFIQGLRAWFDPYTITYALIRRGLPAPELAVSRLPEYARLKRLLDPKNLLNPGKVVD